MKAGQLIGFIADGLPPEAQAALATLQADVPPMAPSASPRASSAASSATTRAPLPRLEPGAGGGRLDRPGAPGRPARRSRGRGEGAVPGRRPGDPSDLDNAELLYDLFSAFALKGLDVKALVDELRARMYDELDYRLEAANQDRVRRPLSRSSVRPHPRRRARAVDAASAHQRVGRRSDVGRVRVASRPCGEATRRRGALPVRPGLDPPRRRVQRRPPSGQLPLPRRRHDHVPRLRPREAMVSGRVGAAVAVPRRDHRRAIPSGACARWSRSGSFGRITASTHSGCTST